MSFFKHKTPIPHIICNCENNYHNFIPIFHSHTNGSTYIVRWCTVCGAVKVDKADPSETRPIHNIQLPELAKTFIKETSK